MKFIFAGILLAVLSAACTTALPGKVELEVGQSTGDSGDEVRVTFLEVLEDNRCLADAMCIWQGNVKVLVEVEYGTEIQQYTLTLGQLLEGDVDSVMVGDHTITVVQVDPYPKASQPTDASDYLVTLNIE